MTYKFKFILFTFLLSVVSANASKLCILNLTEPIPSIVSVEDKAYQRIREMIRNMVHRSAFGDNARIDFANFKFGFFGLPYIAALAKNRDPNVCLPAKTAIAQKRQNFLATHPSFSDSARKAGFPDLPMNLKDLVQVSELVPGQLMVRFDLSHESINRLNSEQEEILTAFLRLQHSLATLSYIRTELMEPYSSSVFKLFDALLAEIAPAKSKTKLKAMYFLYTSETWANTVKLLNEAIVNGATDSHRFYNEALQFYLPDMGAISVVHAGENGDGPTEFRRAFITLYRDPLSLRVVPKLPRGRLAPIFYAGLTQDLPRGSQAQVEAHSIAHAELFKGFGFSLIETREIIFYGQKMIVFYLQADSDRLRSRFAQYLR
jgi:hypothetical protein